MDVQMPEMDGFSATRRIRQIEAEDGAEPAPQRDDKLSRVPIVGMSAHALKGFQDHFAEIGMDDYITKPIKRAEFLMAVSRWISHGPAEKTETAIEEPPASECRWQDQSESLDYQTALNEFMGNTQVLTRVLQVFIENVQRQIPKMRRAGRDRLYEELRKEAHAIKGAAANIAAPALSRLAAELEHLGKKRSLENFDPLFSRFEIEYSRLTQIVHAVSLGNME
jgi:CheY-like chemotaxis protein